MWHTIDNRACKGASISQSFAGEWMPLAFPLPLGCPLKDVSSIAIRCGKSLDVTFESAYQIHIYVDGVFSQTPKILGIVTTGALPLGH